MKVKHLAVLLAMLATLVVVFYPLIISVAVFAVTWVLNVPTPDPHCHSGGG